MTRAQKKRLKELERKIENHLLNEREMHELMFLKGLQEKMMDGPPEDKSLPGPSEVK